MSFFSDFQRLFVFFVFIFFLFGCGGGGGGGGGGSVKHCITPSTTESDNSISRSYFFNEPCSNFLAKLVEDRGRPSRDSGIVRSEVENVGTLYVHQVTFGTDPRRAGYAFYNMMWGSSTCVGYSRCMVSEQLRK